VEGAGGHVGFAHRCRVEVSLPCGESSGRWRLEWRNRR
jgi:hypothetical protein